MVNTWQESSSGGGFMLGNIISKTSITLNHWNETLLLRKLITSTDIISKVRTLPSQTLLNKKIQNGFKTSPTPTLPLGLITARSQEFCLVTSGDIFTENI